MTAMCTRLLSEANGIDLQAVLRLSQPSTPILMLYTSEKDTAERRFAEFAQRKQASVLLVPLSGPSHSVEKMAKKYLLKGMQEVRDTTLILHAIG